MAPYSSTLAWKSHGRRSLVGCSPWGHEESDTTERLHFHFSLSCTGEGNGNPLQCSCLGNPRDGGAWWAAVYGVTQSWTWMKQLSSILCLQINKIKQIRFFKTNLRSLAKGFISKELSWWGSTIYDCQFWPHLFWSHFISHWRLSWLPLKEHRFVV